MKQIKIKQTAEQKKAQPTTKRTRRRRPRRRPKSTAKIRGDIGHTADFAKLFHSPMLDTGPFLITEDWQGQRKDPAAKYISFWATKKVNINTAPRHVLEALFSFGGDAADIAEEIIIRRQIKPFKEMKELENNLYGYSDSIEQSKDFILFQSRIFRIKVTATSGNAKASSAAGILKDKKNAQMIGIISD